MRRQNAREATAAQEDLARQRRLAAFGPADRSHFVLPVTSPSSFAGARGSHAPIARQPLVLSLQRTVGNEAVQRFLRHDAVASLQREDEEDEEDFSESSSATENETTSDEGSESPEVSETATETEPESDTSSESSEAVENSEVVEDSGASEESSESTPIEEEELGSEDGSEEVVDGEGEVESGNGEEIDDPEALAETEESGTIEPIEETDPLFHGDHANPSTSDTVGSHGERLGEPMPLRVNLDFTSSVEQGTSDAGLKRADSITSTLIFSSSVNQGGVTIAADEFGAETAGFSVDLITFSVNAGVVTLEARVNVDCKWDVQSLAPDVSGPNSPAVTSTTWAGIVADLKPGADGKPLRSVYWAKDITERHEKFHASDDIKRAQLFVPTIKAFLNGKTVTGGPTLSLQLRNFLEQARLNLRADSATYYSSVGIGGEGRAYGDGKASYQARVDGIKARAASEKWKP